MDNKLVSWLFETRALRVSPHDKPFWYTSGTIGPYYINTHFLYGSEEKANALLKVIDHEKEDILSCPGQVLMKVRDNYASDAIFKGLIDEMCVYISQKLDISEIDCISGGERRDWFFSLIIAEKLKKPHITIYKNLNSVITDGKGTRSEFDLNGKKLLHVADLITEASSYERAWLPAVESRGGKILWSVVVVDRMQGGGELLAGKGVNSLSMIQVDEELFKSAHAMVLIDQGQLDMVLNYLDDPKGSMQRFIKEHPGFLEAALNSDEKTRERARLCIDKGIYK
jgi:orotate phosphoribosyltransferase